jgi:LytS/YehU family sensor histidine kinase
VKLIVIIIFLFNAQVGIYSELTSVYETREKYSEGTNILKRLAVVQNTLYRRKQNEKLNELTPGFKIKELPVEIKVLHNDQKLAVIISALAIAFPLLVIIVLILRVTRRRLKFRNEMRGFLMTALRCQMNPHFIFNCLNSINGFIAKSQISESTRYLTKFAKLIKMIIDNSNSINITLIDEITGIRLYLDLEAMRFKDRFEFEINIGENCDTENIRIPSMIIQPFIENAIWHGIQHKEGVGRIRVDFALDQDFLICTIEDNGIGRKRSAEFRRQQEQFSSKTQSYGIQITKDRLELLVEDDPDTTLEIVDLIDEAENALGTKVIISIPIILKQR